MSAFSSPSEIARETLKQLALRRIPPTPDHYRELYHEIAGSAPEGAALTADAVRQLARRLPRDTAERLRLARELDQAIAGGKAEAMHGALERYLDSLKSDTPPAWNELIATLLRQWEARQLGWTMARKREALERVLAGSDPNTLFTRLQGLIRSWSQTPNDPDAPPPGEHDAFPREAPAAPAAPAVKLVANGETGAFIEQLRELLLLTLEAVVPASLAEQPELTREAANLAAGVHAAHRVADFAVIGRQLKKFAYRLEIAAGDAAETRAGLLNLLRLLLQNIDEIVLDDQWLRGQVEMLRDIVDKPASLRMIDDAEQRLKEVIYKQSQLKHNLAAAQRELKDMLARFVDQLADFAETTGTYHDRIGNCAERIAAARDITEIRHLLDEVMSETADIQAQARRSREELVTAREQARAAETRIGELQHDLDQASRLMRHDQLTGALNRHGLEEVFAKETARAQRRGTGLCVAMLDIDNFKQLNDSLGHKSGDDALQHLTGVVRGNLRPEDTLARYGGEEFVILYPETTLDEAAAALTRLQRQLTTRFFLADDQKVFITFSAGVTAFASGETMEAALKRADGAMYEAKRSGKNRVIMAPAE